MKRTLQDYIKIGLTVLIIAGMFMPYIYGVLPFDIVFDNNMDLQRLFELTIPILVIIPFMLILIFKGLLKDTAINILNFIFLILYIMVLANFGYGFYDSLDLSDFKEHFPFIVSTALSLLLILSSFKSGLPKSERLETILLAIINFPILLYFTYGFANDLENLNYGSYIISLSFIALYVLSILNIYTNHKSQRSLNQPN